jgi:hypothetical protein
MRTGTRIGAALAAPLLGLIVMFGGTGGLLDATSAGAATLTAQSATGIYKGTFNFTAGQTIKGTVDLKASGKFTISGGGPTGKWSETGTSVTMKGTDGPDKYVFKIKQSGKNLGSKKSPGSISENGSNVGTWYGVR